MNFDSSNGTKMDTSDSRKRPLDGETDNGASKRSNQGGALHYGNTAGSSWQSPESLQGHMGTGDGDASNIDGGRDSIHLKILVPSVAAGAIIGKGGDTIAQVQKEAGARVKMSKANDFYPGTTERVCLIMGPPEAVRHVNNFIMEKIREKPESIPSTPTKPDDAKNFDRHRQVKVLIPNSTAGMIIGKGGSYIKQIKEESGAYVQISQKAKETNLPERCITVAGDLEANMKAMDLILQKIVEDPQSSSCPNISYADYTGPVASANPTGSPFANNPYQGRGNDMMNNSAAYQTQGFNFGANGNNSYNGMGGLAGLNMTLSAAAMGLGGPMANQALENLKMTLRNAGYTEHATEEISAAMNTLANYGILGMGMGGMNQMGANMTASGLAGMQMAGATAGAAGNTPFGSATSQGANMFGPVGSSSSQQSGLFGSSSPNVAGVADRYGSSQMLNDAFGQSQGYGASAGTMSYQSQERSPVTVNVNQNSFGLGTGMYSPSDDKTSTKQEIEVPENIVGAILGPGGKGIVEIQQFTGTNIQISKKGVYAPGTHNRVVSISGSMGGITRAQYMIQQRIQQEEYKRARQATAR
ncbi:hypothetical protein BsWGS_14667 [Bradybaena similaris]